MQSDRLQVFSCCSLPLSSHLGQAAEGENTLKSPSAFHTIPSDGSVEAFLWLCSVMCLTAETQTLTLCTSVLRINRIPSLFWQQQSCSGGRFQAIRLTSLKYFLSRFLCQVTELLFLRSARWFASKQQLHKLLLACVTAPGKKSLGQDWSLTRS